MLGETVDRKLREELLKRDVGDSYLEFDSEVLADKYNRLPFSFSHKLTDHPNFQLEALRALSLRLPRQQITIRRGEIPIDMNFDRSFSDLALNKTIEHAFDCLETERLYIVIYNPERDPEFRPTAIGLLAEIAKGIRELDASINWMSTYVFISSHASVTPYHMDREMNFLLQIRGEKTDFLWDPMCDNVMTDIERDRLFGVGDDDSRPLYRPELSQRALRFQLRPGDGIHHPFIAPHMVQTDNNLSVSYAVTYRTDLSDIWSDAYRMNHHLRRVFLSLGKVRRSGLADNFRANLFRTLIALKSRMRRAG